MSIRHQFFVKYVVNLSQFLRDMFNDLAILVYMIYSTCHNWVIWLALKYETSEPVVILKWYISYSTVHYLCIFAVVFKCYVQNDVGLVIWWTCKSVQILYYDITASSRLHMIARSQYIDVIMGSIASQITSLTIVYSSVYSGANQRKHQSSASLAFVRGIHRTPVNSSRTKGQ